MITHIFILASYYELGDRNESSNDESKKKYP